MRELVYGNAWDDGPDVAELRSVTRRFVGDFVEQRAQELDEREEFPADLYAQMARLNMFGITSFRRRRLSSYALVGTSHTTR